MIPMFAQGVVDVVVKWLYRPEDYMQMLYTLQKHCQLGLPICRSGVGLHEAAETPGSVEMEAFKEVFEMVQVLATPPPWKLG